MTQEHGAGAQDPATVLGALQAEVDRITDPARTPASWSAGAGGGPGVGPDDPEYARAKTRALNMLGARDHSAAELRKKLLGKEHPAEVVDVLIERLVASNLIDDAAYARAFVRDHRERRRLSVAALKRELTRKGIAEHHAAAAVADLDDESDLALEVARKKARTTRTLAYDTRLRRVLGMLGRRGFAGSTAMDAARTALDEYPAE
ncbi:regulatory protein RecX [Brevibacterium litoralis]|uniref:regulatory protein RecX n=1 Tax=Brevibacterium litoralis TaxID=3138935 RepID=UPI0032F055A8